MKTRIALMLIMGTLGTASLPATTVYYQAWRFTGTTNNRPITISLRSDVLAINTNLVFGVPVTYQPTNGVVTNKTLLPAGYWLAIDQVNNRLPFDVPDGTNNYNLIDLINKGIYVYSPTQQVNGITVAGENIGVATDKGTNTVSLALTNATKFAGQIGDWWANWNAVNMTFYLTNATDGGGLSLTSDGVLRVDAEMDAPFFGGSGLSLTDVVHDYDGKGTNTAFWNDGTAALSVNGTGNVATIQFSGAALGGQTDTLQLNPVGWRFDNYDLYLGASGTHKIFADGSPLTALNASQLSSGTVPFARLPGLPATNTLIDLSSALDGGSTHSAITSSTNAPAAFNLGFATNYAPAGDYVKQWYPVPPLLISTYNDANGGRDWAITNAQYYITNFIAHALTNGMKLAGWTNAQIEDGQYATNRDGNGDLQPSQWFPNGFEWITTYAHTNGFRLNDYINVADGVPCFDKGTVPATGNGGNPGTHWNQLERDIRKVYDWGFDGITVDSCGDNAGDNNMRALLVSRTFNSIFYDPYAKMPYNTVTNRGGYLLIAMNQNVNYTLPWESTVSINSIGVNANDGHPGATIESIVHECMTYDSKLRFTRPGHYYAPSALPPIPGGMPSRRKHFYGYAMAAAQINTTYELMNEQEKDLMINRGWIDILQDPAVIPATVIGSLSNANTEVWIRPLGSANSKTNAVFITNKDTNAAHTVTVTTSDLGLFGETLTLQNPCVPQTYSNFTTAFTWTVPKGECDLLKVFPAGGAILSTKTYRTGIVSFTGGTVGTFASLNPTDAGTVIQPSTDLYVSHLGRWVTGGIANTNLHVLTIRSGDGNCTELARTVVDTYRATSNQFIYAPILGGPVKLTAGLFYFIGSTETLDYFVDAAVVTPNADVSVSRSFATTCGGGTSGSLAEGPVNFLYTTTNDTSYVVGGINGLLINSNSLASIPRLGPGQNYYWSSNGVAYVICSSPSGVLTTNKLGP